MQSDKSQCLWGTGGTAQIFWTLFWFHCVVCFHKLLFALLPVLTTTGKECKFPFRQGGRIHHHCITILSSKPWWVLVCFLLASCLESGSAVLVTQTIAYVCVTAQSYHTLALDRQTTRHLTGRSAASSYLGLFTTANRRPCRTVLYVTCLWPHMNINTGIFHYKLQSEMTLMHVIGVCSRSVMRDLCNSVTRKHNAMSNEVMS